MMTTICEGMEIKMIDENVYSVRDARGRNLGGVVRFWAPAADGKGCVRRFSAFGEVFESLASAVREFHKIRGARSF
jgi:hypothetical protein